MCLGFEEHDVRLDNVGTVVIKIVLCDLGGSKPATCKTVKHSITTFWLLWRQFRNVLDFQEYGNNICNFISMLDMFFLFRIAALGQDYRQNSKEFIQHISYIKYMLFESQEYEPKACKLSFNLSCFLFFGCRRVKIISTSSRSVIRMQASFFGNRSERVRLSSFLFYFLFLVNKWSI